MDGIEIDLGFCGLGKASMRTGGDPWAVLMGDMRTEERERRRGTKMRTNRLLQGIISNTAKYLCFSTLKYTFMERACSVHGSTN